MKKKIKFKTVKKKVSYNYVFAISLVTLIIAILMRAISDVLLDFFSGVCGILITLLIFKFFKFIKNREKKEF